MGLCVEFGDMMTQNVRQFDGVDEERDTNEQSRLLHIQTLISNYPYKVFVRNLMVSFVF